MYVADHWPACRIDALKMAILAVQDTYNVNLYQQLHRRMQEAIVGQVLKPYYRNSYKNMSDSERFLSYRMAPAQIQALQIPVYDMAWAEGKMKKAALKLEKLDTDLKNYKANSIKESIRRGHDDLGDHYLDYGDLSNALKCYSRARDYCTSSKHVIHMCLNVIKVHPIGFITSKYI